MDDTPFEILLRQQLQAGDEPRDNGFSLRVMAALPAQIPARRRPAARWARRGQWAATGLAACGLAVLSTRQELTRDLPHALAALALLALLVFWAVPSRWSRG
ncbi:hypothetical protein DBR42_23480 [Pelomonas sp. HMWF004]|nr:hypothetical protein DBR42_23480 [Pelomonas sp. HMWF004]